MYEKCPRNKFLLPTNKQIVIFEIQILLIKLSPRQLVPKDVSIKRLLQTSYIKLLHLSHFLNVSQVLWHFDRFLEEHKCNLSHLVTENRMLVAHNTMGRYNSTYSTAYSIAHMKRWFQQFNKVDHVYRILGRALFIV